MKQKMKALLELPAAANDREQLEALGVSPDDMDNEMVLVMSMFLSAAQGDTKAFDRVIQILGKDIAHEELALKSVSLSLRKNFPGITAFTAAIWTGGRTFTRVAPNGVR